MKNFNSDVFNAAGKFADDFVDELRTGKFAKDNLPNKGQDVDADFIRKRADAYDNLVESKLLDKFFD